MAVRPIRIFPDDILSSPCRLVEDFGEPLASLVRDLRDTMKASPGVGLAAPQIGVPLRVSFIDVGRVLKNRKLESSYHGPVTIVNPELIAGRGIQVPREGCLSIPDLLANVSRHLEVDVSFRDEAGEPRTITAKGFEALAFQHEIDHLNGKLFLDRVANLKTDIFRRKTAS